MKLQAILSYLTLFFLAISSLHAGFGGAGVTAVPIAETPITKERIKQFDQKLSEWEAGGQSGPRPTYPAFEDVAPGRIAQLKMFPPYSGMTNAQVTERVRQMRRAILCVIGLIKSDDPATGMHLERLLGLGKICFGLSRDNRGLGASIFADGKTEFGIEPINIFYNVDKDLSLTDQETFRLYVALTHESLHGKQEILRPTGSVGTVREAVDLQCREIEAHEQEVAQYDEIIRLLEHYRDHGTLPTDGKGGTKAFAEAIARANTAAGNNNLLNSWLRWLAAERQQRSLIVRFRKVYKEAGQARIDGTLDANQLRERLRPFQPWVDFYGNKRDFRILQTIIYNPDAPVTVGPAEMREIVPPGNTVRQISQNNTQETDITIPDCDSVIDGFIAEDKNKFYYSGIRYGTPDMGVIGSYDLDPVTLDIMPATQQTCIENPILGGGVRLVENPFTGECFGLAFGTAILFLLDDTNGDHCFDTLVPMGAMPQGPRMEVVDAFFSDANTIWGTPFTPDSCPDVLQPISMATRTGSGSAFQGDVPQTWKDILRTGPSIGTLPYEGREDLICAGTPGRDFSVWYVPSGGTPRQVGNGTFSWGGLGWTDLSEPIGQDPLRILDHMGAQSPLMPPAPAPGDPRIFAGPALTTGTAFFNISAFPGEKLDSQHSGTLQPSSWTNGPGMRADCFGVAQFKFGFPHPDVDQQFFRFGSSVYQMPPPVPAPTFSAVPGVTSLFDVSQPGCLRYEIVNGPALHLDVFQFFPDGRFAITPINLGDDYSFTYRTVFAGRSGLLLGDPVTVEIEGDTTPLTDPEPFIGEDGGEYVNALVLPYGGQHFPLYQIWVRNSPFDLCVEPHWHLIDVPMFSIEDPSTPVSDPAPGNCGFGKRKDLPPVLFRITLAEWDSFKANHPPNPGLFP